MSKLTSVTVATDTPSLSSSKDAEPDSKVFSLDLRSRPFRRHSARRWFAYGLSVSPTVSWPLKAEMAIRYAVTAALGSSLISYSSLQNWPQPYVIGALALFGIQPTLGATIQTCIAMCAGGVIVGCITALIQVMRVNTSSIALAFVLFAVCVLYGYFLRLPGLLRVCLAFTVIWFLHTLDEPADYSFAFFIIAECIMGNIFSIIAALLPFPHTATLEIDDRFYYGCAQSAHLFSLYARMWICKCQVSADMIRQQAQLPSTHIIESLTAIRTRLAESAYEPRYIMDLLRGDSRAGGFTPAKLVDHLHHFTSTLLGMSDSLQLIDYDSDFHTQYVRRLEKPLMSLANACHDFLESIAGTSIDWDKAYEQQQMMMAAFKQLQNDHYHARQIIHDYHLHIATSPDNAPSTETPSVVMDTPIKTVESTDDKTTLLTDTQTLTSREMLAFNAFLFYTHQFVRLLSQLDCSPATHPAPHSGALYIWKTFNRHQVLLAWWPYWSLCLSYNEWMKYYAWNSTNAKQSIKMGLAMTLGALIAIIPESAERFNNAFWISITIGFIQSLSTGALVLTSAARLIGTLLGVSASYLMDAAFGQNFAGLVPAIAIWAAICGYARVWTVNWAYAAVIAALTPILLIYGLYYTGQTDISAYGFLRIQETVLGIIIALVIGIGLWPIEASALIRMEFISVLRACHKSISTSFEEYNEQLQTTIQPQQSIVHGALAKTATATTDIPPPPATATLPPKPSLTSSYTIAITGSLARQSRLLVECTYQWSLWSRPFPSSYFQTLIIRQQTIWRLLLSLDRSLFELMLINDKSNTNNKDNHNNNNNNNNNNSIQFTFLQSHGLYFSKLRDQVITAVEMILRSMMTDDDVMLLSTHTTTNNNTPTIHTPNNSNNNLKKHKKFSISLLCRQLFDWSSTASLSALPTDELLQRESDISSDALLSLHQTLKTIETEHRQWVDHVLKAYRLAQMEMPSNEAMINFHAFLYSATELIMQLIAVAQAVKVLFRLEQPLSYDNDGDEEDV